MDKGNMIVNIDMLARQLICKKCNNVLSLLDITSNIASGLGTTYYIPCQKCQHTNNFLTDKQHNFSGSSTMTFNYTTKAVIGEYR